MSILHVACNVMEKTPLRPIAILLKNIKNRIKIYYYKKEMGRETRHNKQLSELRNILKQRPVKVAFQIAQLGKWKSEPVLQLMMEDPKFDPMIWIVPVGIAAFDPSDPIHAHEKSLIHEQFDSYNIPVVEYGDISAFPAKNCPDIIFIHEEYDYIFRSSAYQKLDEKILCHIPYCFHNTANNYEFNGIGNNITLFNFYENAYICTLGAEIAQNKGINNVATGNPQADIFIDKAKHSESVWKECGHPMKKVIWAPHWTILANTNTWFNCGTFLKTADTIVSLAQKYASQIQFAFKPHPLLYRALCNHPEWGQEKTDAYYRLWAEMPNTQLAEEEYAALFMQSDAMIHDSGSFILEYLFADKPAMFLREGEGYGNYNEMTLDALKCYHKGLTKEDIEDFLQRCVLRTEDPLAEIRHDILQKYLLPPNGKTAAENIVDTLKNV